MVYNLAMAHDPALFQSTADYYARFRPPKPAALYTTIAKQFGLDAAHPEGVLMDLGCGTGEMVLPLADYFAWALAWDPDPEMLAQARRKLLDFRQRNPRAAERISLVEKSSEHLPDLTAVSAGAAAQTLAPAEVLARHGGGLRLVTMGQSFHWMNKREVLQQLYPALRPGGGLVIIDALYDIPKDNLDARKNELIHQLVAKYLGPRRRAGKSFFKNDQESYIDLLREAGYQPLGEAAFDTIRPVTIDQVVGHVFSLSWASKFQLGNLTKPFEAELRAGLADLLKSAGAKHFDELMRFDMFMAAK